MRGIHRLLVVGGMLLLSVVAVSGAAAAEYSSTGPVAVSGASPMEIAVVLESVRIGPDSRVLLIATQGPTEPATYRHALT
jgi:hypothetical protein